MDSQKDDLKNIKSKEKDIEEEEREEINSKSLEVSTQTKNEDFVDNETLTSTNSGNSMISRTSQFLERHETFLRLFCTSFKMACVVAILIIISNTNLTIENLTAITTAMKHFRGGVGIVSNITDLL